MRPDRDISGDELVEKVIISLIVHRPLHPYYWGPRVPKQAPPRNPKPKREVTR